MVEYKGKLISKNSDAYKMWIEKDFKRFDAHLERLKKEAKKRRHWYE